MFLRFWFLASVWPPRSIFQGLYRREEPSGCILGSIEHCKGFKGIRGHATPKNIKHLRSSNCWKCIEIVNPTTTTLFLYHFKSFTIPSDQADHFGSWGVRAQPRASPLPTGLLPIKGAHLLAIKTNSEVEMVENGKSTTVIW